MGLGVVLMVNPPFLSLEVLGAVAAVVFLVRVLLILAARLFWGVLNLERGLEVPKLLEVVGLWQDLQNQNVLLIGEAKTHVHLQEIGHFGQP